MHKEAHTALMTICNEIHIMIFALPQRGFNKLL